MYEVVLRENMRGMSVPAEVKTEIVTASDISNLVRPYSDIVLRPDSDRTHISGVLYAHSIYTDRDLTVSGKTIVERDLNARSLAGGDRISVGGTIDVIGDAKSYREIVAGYIRSAGNVIAGSVFSLDGIRAKGNIVGVHGIGTRGPIRGGTIYCSPNPGIWAYDNEKRDCEIRAEGILPSLKSVKRGFYTRVYGRTV